MHKFAKLTSRCIPIRTENIDTDQIVPARFLKITSREGFGKYLFYDWRFDKNGKPKNNPYFHDLIDESKKILVAGNNFGCGSSREHAVWALQDFGFEAVVSSSFGDIFYNNALKNGLLPVIINQAELKHLFKIIEMNPKQKITIDLAKQIIIYRAEPVSGLKSDKKTRKQVQNVSSYVLHFPIDSFRKTCLIKGVDELGYILSFEEKINKFEKFHKIYIPLKRYL